MEGHGNSICCTLHNHFLFLSCPCLMSTDTVLSILFPNQAASLDESRFKKAHCKIEGMKERMKGY